MHKTTKYVVKVGLTRNPTRPDSIRGWT